MNGQVVVPQGWTLTTLGELGEYQNGRGFKKTEWSDSGRPIIRIQDLTGTGDSPNYFAGEVDPRHVVQPGDLLVSWAATLDAFLWRGPEAVLNQHIFRCRSHIEPAFHYYLLKFVMGKLRARAHGSGMVHVTKKEFDSLPVAVPPPETQRQIADAIETQFSRIDQAEGGLTRARASLRRYRRAVVDAAATGSLHMPSPGAVGPTEAHAWPWETVGDNTVEVRYGTSSKCDSDATGIPVLRMGNIVDDRLSLARLKYLPVQHEEFPGLLLRDGDVLFNRTNSPELVGKAAVYRGSPARCSFASYLIRVRLKPTVAPDWLVIVLSSSIGRRWVADVVSQQVGQANVNGSKLKAFRLPTPPLQTQLALSAEVDRRLSVVDDLLVRLDNDLRRAAGLRSSVLQQAFAGKLT